MTTDQATKLAETLRSGRCYAEAQPDGRIHFLGGRHGPHSLDIGASDQARVLAHWAGYCELQASKTFGRAVHVGAKVMFHRGMYGLWRGTVEHLGMSTTSYGKKVPFARIRFTRRNGTIGRLRVDCTDVHFPGEAF